jgi:phage-related baseplate assembly protein
MSLNFLDTNTAEILRAAQGYFEAASNRTLYPAQVENLLLHTLAYRESRLRNNIQWCAEQNLVAYAIGEHLDALGVMMDTRRLQPTAAECRVQFTLDAPTQPGRSFPAGTRITTEDGKIVFETLDACYVITGQTHSSIVGARCITLGTAANGLDKGVLCALDTDATWGTHSADADGVASVRFPTPLSAPSRNESAIRAVDGVSVKNVTATEGGGDLETDTAYRERLSLSAARFGCGGSAKAYRYWALSASSLVADALADKSNDDSGNIHLYILSKDGKASYDLCKIVENFCNQDTVRLINDFVRVFPATECPYRIKAEITVYDTHDPEIVLDKVRALAHEYTLRQQVKLGADVTPTQVLMALKTVSEGLYQVNLIEPAGIVSVGLAEYANCAGIDIRLAGVTNG